MKKIVNFTAIILGVMIVLFAVHSNSSDVSASNTYQLFLPLIVNGEGSAGGNLISPTNTPTPGELTPKPVEPTPTSTPVTPTPTNTPVTPTSTPISVPGNSFYVAPNGSPSGDGSVNRPWDIQTALSHPSSVHAGDTIWLRGGTYTGQFTCNLRGAQDQPIVVRQYPGERAILEHTGLIIDIQNTWYVDFWGFEIRSNNNPRDPETRPEWAYGVRVNQGTSSNHIRFINMFIHDMPAQGFGWWIANTDSDIYGSLVYYNGVTELDHGIYLKNQEGTKIIEDNFVFDNASHGVHGHSASEDTLNDIHVIGNTIFNNGSVGYNTSKQEYGVYKRNILVGGYERSYRPEIIENYTYYPGTAGQSLNVGYSGGSDDAIVEGNYLMGGQVQIGGTYTNVTMENNTIYASSLLGFTQSQFPDNTYKTSKPTGTKIFVRPNKFEENRANITIYNWNHNDTVILTSGDLAELSIPVGAYYELHNVQDYFSDVVTGVYDGSSIVVPMIGHSVAQPLGLSFKPASTFPEFGGFVLYFTTP